MAELDTIVLTNPTSEDFSQNFNGETYTIEANSSKSFAQFVGFHLAKHFAQKIVKDDITAKMRKEHPTLLPQRLVHDNPYFRIALYRILNDVKLVQTLIASYPFKGFVGDMKLYEEFVVKNNQPKDDKKVVEKKKE